MRIGALALAAALATAACGVRAEGPPPIVVDRTPCSHCGMLISEPLYAAAYQAPGTDARVFDDIGCLRDAARELAACPTVAVLQHNSDVLQVAYNYFENAMTYFTRRINRCISISGSIVLSYGFMSADCSSSLDSLCEWRDRAVCGA